MVTPRIWDTANRIQGVGKKLGQLSQENKLRLTLNRPIPGGLIRPYQQEGEIPWPRLDLPSAP